MSWAVEQYELSSFSPADKVQTETGFCCGVEYEIEHIISASKLNDNNIFGINIDKDHSLRNNGHEFKTPPLSFDNSLKAFDEVHAKVEYGNTAFTDRTSIHVHVNCRDLEPQSLREVVLCYALVEPLFLEYVGNVRKNSIFCVPLNYTYLPDIYKKSIDQMIKEWHKYTAFNIVPLKQFGTMEFRHLFGTNNKEVFRKWLTAIRNVFDFIRNNPEFSILQELNQGETAATLARQICPTFSSGKTDFYLNETLKNTLLDVKLAGGGFYK